MSSTVHELALGICMHELKWRNRRSMSVAQSQEPFTYEIVHGFARTQVKRVCQRSAKVDFLRAPWFSPTGKV